MRRETTPAFATRLQSSQFAIMALHLLSIPFFNLQVRGGQIDPDIDTIDSNAGIQNLQINDHLADKSRHKSLFYISCL